VPCPNLLMNGDGISNAQERVAKNTMKIPLENIR